MNATSYPIARIFTSIAACLILLCAPLRTDAADPQPQAGKIVGFENAQGKALFLHDFKGRPVLINLWATWCAPCVEEMPSLDKLQRAYASKGLAVIALSQDEKMEDVLAFYKKNNITGLEAYVDKEHGVYSALKVRGLPTTVLITREGEMKERVEGPVDWQSPQALSQLAVILK